MNELALFAGIGGGILGGKLLGWRTVCAVEWEAYPASVLCARQNDKILPPFPIWDDVQTFDGKPWRGIVDVVSGGFPCTDISVAGKGAGINGEASGMWREMARIIGEIRPRYAFMENSPMLLNRGFERVLNDFSKLGYDCKWGLISASSIGAPHERNRIWLVAKTNVSNSPSQRLQRGGKNRKIARPLGLRSREGCNKEQRFWYSSNYWEIEPGMGRVANGIPCRVDRIKAIGNGQVPLCAATAWRLLNDE